MKKGVAGCKRSAGSLAGCHRVRDAPATAMRPFPLSPAPISPRGAQSSERLCRRLVGVRPTGRWPIGRQVGVCETDRARGAGRLCLLFTRKFRGNFSKSATARRGHVICPCVFAELGVFLHVTSATSCVGDVADIGGRRPAESAGPGRSIFSPVRSSLELMGWSGVHPSGCTACRVLFIELRAPFMREESQQQALATRAVAAAGGRQL
jgi:hypothetical protein